MRRRRSLGSHESDDLLLWIDNDEPLYKQKRAIQVNLTRKVCASKFSKQRAAVGFSHVTQPAAAAYRRETGVRILVADRREADRDLVKEYLARLFPCLARKQCNDLPDEARALLAKSTCMPGGQLSDSRPRARRRR